MQRYVAYLLVLSARRSLDPDFSPPQSMTGVVTDANPTSIKQLSYMVQGKQLCFFCYRIAPQPQGSPSSWTHRGWTQASVNGRACSSGVHAPAVIAVHHRLELRYHLPPAFRLSHSRELALPHAAVLIVGAVGLYPLFMIHKLTRGCRATSKRITTFASAIRSSLVSQ